MYTKVLLNILFIIVVVVLQTSFVNGLPFFFSNANILLIILVFILVLGGLKKALWWTAGAGFLFDIFSFLPFGVFMMCFFLAILITHFLLVNFFTNRSIYSFLALTLFITISFELFLFFAKYFTKMLFHDNIHLVIDFRFWQQEFMQLSLNLFITLILFYIVNFVSKKLKPVFLFAGSKG